MSGNPGSPECDHIVIYEEIQQDHTEEVDDQGTFTVFSSIFHAGCYNYLIQNESVEASLDVNKSNDEVESLD